MLARNDGLLHAHANRQFLFTAVDGVFLRCFDGSKRSLKIQ